ncbi:hypothetical protein [Nocardia altamirensis]|uniref:hypothetical protein n=1 Tax=Nocardia altamirensis TaxID=472158 RepID=UPI000B009799|nr:hypothetical protein [Nocardia altamirensis]
MTDEPDAIAAVPRRRLLQFPGGLLEIQSYGDEAEDCSGIYLELFGPLELDSHEDGEAVMKYRPTAVGYLRTDVSGLAQLWDQGQIRRLATRLGYDFADMVIYDPKFGRPPLARLKAQATRLEAEAVIVPSPEHFDGGQAPGALVKQLDVITLTPEATYARRVMPPFRALPPVKAEEA